MCIVILNTLTHQLPLQREFTQILRNLKVSHGKQKLLMPLVSYGSGNQVPGLPWLWGKHMPPSTGSTMHSVSMTAPCGYHKP